MQQIITNCSDFTRGVARFVRIATNAKTGVEAWRRSYKFKPYLDVVEFIVPQGGRFYPEENRITRRIPARDPKLREKMEFYLQNGIDGWFEGDEPKGIFDDDDE